MDRDSLIQYFQDRNFDSLTSALIEEMSGMLTDDQFKECLRRAFAEKCREESDVEFTIEQAIENTWVDIESAYYDDEKEEEYGVPSIDECLKDNFYFVKMMFDAGLDAEAVEFCARIAEGLGNVSKIPKYSEYRENLEDLRTDLLNHMGRGECSRWFDYRFGLTADQPNDSKAGC